MVALETPQAEIGWKAVDFALPATDGSTYSLDDVRGPTGLLVAFICNHCPYVQKQLDRLIADATALKAHGINTIAIMSNDAEAYPDDSFESMKSLAQTKAFPFPYVMDETQEIARAYGAVCTPDFFGFDKDLTLQYRGRLDESWSGVIDNPRRELREAMEEIARTGTTQVPQNPSIGCSIKWRDAGLASLSHA